MKTLFKILKKIIWFIIFVVVLILAIYFAYLGILKFEFSDPIKFQDITYSDEDNSICLKFTKDNYVLDNCNGSKTNLKFDSSNKCNMFYGKGFNSLVFDCGLLDKSLVRLNEFNFNKIKFKNENKKYDLLNKSIFEITNNNEKITFNFVDSKKIKFVKYNKSNNTIIEEETCPYKYEYNSINIKCKNFYRNTSFQIDNYKNGELVIANDTNKLIFNLEK